MFRWRDLFRRKEGLADGIVFDTTGWVEQPGEPRQRVWHNERGDRVGLVFLPIPPDIPAPLDAVDLLRQRFRSKMNAGLIQLDVLSIGGIPSVKVIAKNPQQPHGMTYVASWTFPRRYFSYVLKILCVEDGTTGIREAVVMDEEIMAGRVSIDDEMGLRGWDADLYDRTFRGDLVRNLAEDARYDARFPDHPLSRLRGYLGQLEPTIVVSAAVRNAPPFEGPAIN